MPNPKKVSIPGVPKLGEILIEKRALSSRDLRLALQHQQEKLARGEKVLLGQLLTEMELISYSDLYHALDEQINWLKTELGRKYHQTAIITDLSSQILRASNRQELIAIINNNLPAVDHISLLHLFEEIGPSVPDSKKQNNSHKTDAILFGTQINVWREISKDDLATYLNPGEPLLLSNENHPPQLRNLFKIFREQLGFRSIVLIPIYVFKILAGFLFVGSRESDLTLRSVQYHNKIAQLTETGLERVAELEVKDRNLKILETLDRIGQAISLETDLNKLYNIIHQQVVEVIGDVDFMIATYDPDSETLDIPYAIENGESVSKPSIPLGEELTSIPIRKRQPIRIVEDTEARAMELGAKTTGLQAKSWMGVPLLISGEPTGAIVVQDKKHEQRFNEIDQRLLTSLASQVAVAIRNANLFQEIREKSERERILAEFTSRIWSSPDMETILRNAISELGRNLDVDDGSIQLEYQNSALDTEW